MPVTQGLSDEELRRLIDQIPPSPLLAALIQSSGRYDEADAVNLVPDAARVREVSGGLSAAQQESCRDLAYRILQERENFEDSNPSDDDLRRLATLTIGDVGGFPQYLTLLREQVDASAGDSEAPQWSAGGNGNRAAPRVAIIGAGVSGLLMAHRLKQVGIDFRIYDKEPEVGGTWRDNTYPGCRVDVPSLLYSFSFLPYDWTDFYASQESLLDYLRHCVKVFDLEANLETSTEVVSADFEDETGLWRLKLKTANETRVVDADIVISAVGQLNRPNTPALPGAEIFTGRQFHSAEWPPDFDAAGKRVAVIGTGASAVQFVPELAREAAQVDIYQRSPAWFIPTPDYHDPLTDGIRWALDNVANFRRWYRFWLFWRSAEGLLPAAILEEGPTGLTTGSANAELRKMFEAYILEHAPDGIRRDIVVPDYPPTAKRMLRENGAWFGALRQENVSVITDRISGLTRDGIETVKGSARPIDAVVYATGFRASEFLAPMRIQGRNGVDVHAEWRGQARAYLGMTVPSAPNFFMLYGPNTNLVVNGSIFFMVECQTRYVVDAIHLLVARGSRAIACKRDVHDKYCAAIDDANAHRTWGAPGINSWYKNAEGKVTQNWPYSLAEYSAATKSVSPEDFEFID